MHADLENNHFVLNRTTVLLRTFLCCGYKRVWIVLKVCKDKNFVFGCSSMDTLKV